MKIIKNIRQRGFVSIIVATIIMILLSLITLGFSRAMQREYRESLDRQLYRQATYAAESGINLTWDYLVNNLNDGSIPEEKQDCADSSGSVFGLNSGVESIAPAEAAYFNGEDSSGSSLQITCVLYDKSPQQINTQVPADYSKPILLKTRTGESFGTITIDIYPVEGEVWSGGFSCGNFPSNSSMPHLRFDITSSDNTTRDALNNSTNFMYLMPCDFGSNVALETDRNIIKPNILCSLRSCTVDIDASSLDSSEFIVNLKSLYRGANISISGEELGTSNSVEFIEMQSSVDVTARSTDVVKRLQASIPISDPDQLPSGVVHSASSGSGVCKDYAIVDGESIQDNCD